MRTAFLALMILTATLGIVALAPTAPAVGICSQYTHAQCGDYVLCVGYRWDSYGFQCTGTGVRDPCRYICPPPYLP